MTSTHMSILVGIILLALLAVGVLPGMISRAVERRDARRRDRHNRH